MIINALNGKIVPASMANITKDIQVVASNCSRVSFFFVKRQGNKAAQAIAAKAIRDFSFICLLARTIWFIFWFAS